MCARVRAERNKVGLRVGLIYGYCRRGEKFEEKSDGNFVGKGRIREVNRNEEVRILGRDNSPDLRQVEIIGPDSIPEGRGSVR